jgi:glycosyltransferase involved in cell wall biosynthesis
MPSATYTCPGVLRRLGINAVFLEPPMGGLETYTRQLIPQLLEARPSLQVTIFVNAAGAAMLAEEDWSALVSVKTHPLLGRRGVRAASESLLLGAIAKRARVDLLHSLAMTAPLWPGVPSVVNMPDVTWLRVPGAVPRPTRLLWRTVVIPAARAARRLITLSEVAKGEIVADLGVSPSRIDVVPLGPGGDPPATLTPEVDVRERFGLGRGPIVLAVSPLLAHKNLPPLIEAMAAVRRTAPEVVLVVAGHLTPLHADLASLATRLESPTVFVGWISSADLEGLYQAASCFAFPSIREGFGLPVLEAMRRGVPVVCSNISAIPEVAGDAALLVDPRRPGELGDAISRVLHNDELAHDLARRGKGRAAEFSWRRTAEETLASYDRALG